MIPIQFNGSVSEGLKILCIGAHSDDIEIGCGATLLKLIANKQVSEIRWVVFTGGGVGGSERSRPCALAEVGGIRLAQRLHREHLR